MTHYEKDKCVHCLTREKSSANRSLSSATRVHFFLSDSYPEEINMTQNGCCVQLKAKSLQPTLRAHKLLEIPRICLPSRRPWCHVREQNVNCWMSALRASPLEKSPAPTSWICLTAGLKMEISHRKSGTFRMTCCHRTCWLPIRKQ